MPQIRLHAACGNHAQALSQGVPGEAEIALHNANPHILHACLRGAI